MDTNSQKIHVAIKLGFTVFVAILVPKYWMDYGPTNFLYFCDISLFFALLAVWTERPIWASAAGVGILLPQAIWMVDFLGTSVGHPLVGATRYMFDAGIPLFTRGLSSFHLWLPFFLLYLISRLGYDRRAFLIWTALSLVLLPICYFFLPAPPHPAGNPNTPVNVNYVYGFSEEAAQTWMPPGLWLGTVMAGLPLLFYWPTHRILMWKRLGIRQ